MSKYVNRFLSLEFKFHMLIKNFLSNQTDLSVLSQTKDHLFIKNYLQAFDAPF